MKLPTRNDLLTPDSLERVFKDIYYKLQQVQKPAAEAEKTVVPTPAQVSAALKATGVAPLNVQGLIGQLAQPQLAYIPTVTELPPWNSQLAQTSGVVRYVGTLWVYDQTSSPGTWVMLKAGAVAASGLYAAIPAVTAANNGLLYYATDRNLTYIVEAGSWTQLPPDASTTQTGLVNTADQEFNGVKTFDDGIVVDADAVLASTSTLYFGAAATDGTWKVVRNGTDLEISRREAGSYVVKATVIA